MRSHGRDWNCNFELRTPLQNAGRQALDMSLELGKLSYKPCVGNQLCAYNLIHRI